MDSKQELGEELKVDELSEQFEAFFKTLSDEVDKKFEEIDKQLREKEEELIEATKLELIEVNQSSKNIKRMEAEIFEKDKSQRKLEDVNKYKDCVKNHIKKCEDLDGYLTTIKNFNLDDILTIKKDGFKLLPKKLDYLKNYLKSKGQYKCELKWMANQKKACTISENGSSITVSFNSCWNDFHSVPFKSEVEEIILELNINNSSTYHSIGITNENFNGTSFCIGCQSSSDAWVLKLNGATNNAGTNTPCDIKLPQLGKFILIMTFDWDKKLLCFKDKDGKSSPPFELKGNEFKVTFGMCTSGSCTYKFLDSI